MMDKLGIPGHIFPEIVPPGTRLGTYEGIPVIAPACHDTGSAVAAMPTSSDKFAYISSGTWSLVGLEVPQPILTPQALAANVTNEGGVYGTYRLLKNIVGLWILQQCRATWAAAGNNYSYGELVAVAEKAEPFTAVINPNDPRFLPHGDHPQNVKDYCAETGQPVPADVGSIVRCVLESLAMTYRETLDTLRGLTQRSIDVLHIVGGGTQNQLLNQMTADATGLPVVTGPIEATVIGNALVQLITLGEIADLRQARQIVAGMAEMNQYKPNDTAVWDEMYGRYQEIISQSSAPI
jgi:rhamnulokinase